MRDVHATSEMCACSVHMPNDIQNMLNMYVCVCVHTGFPQSPCPTHVWTTASPPRYLLVSSLSAGPRLEVLVQKIETTLWERRLLFPSLV